MTKVEVRIAFTSDTVDPWKNSRRESGVLYLDAQEVADFEQWMAGPSEPTDYMREVAKLHKMFRRLPHLARQKESTGAGPDEAQKG